MSFTNLQSKPTSISITNVTTSSRDGGRLKVQDQNADVLYEQSKYLKRISLKLDVLQPDGGAFDVKEAELLD